MTLRVRLTCPKCGGVLECDEVDNGVGIQQCGPYGCPSCHWIEDDLRTLSADSPLRLPQQRALNRSYRQTVTAKWCANAFGVEHATSVKQRAVRLLEEVLEAYQAAGADPAMAHKLIDFIFARPVGVITQEIGGIGVTLLAFAEAVGVDADECERLEVERVLAKPLAHFAERNDAKNAAGFNVTGSRVVDDA